MINQLHDVIFVRFKVLKSWRCVLLISEFQNGSLHPQADVQ